MNEMRHKDYTDLPTLRRMVIERDMEIARLREKIPATTCEKCRFSTKEDGIFRHCWKRGLEVVPDDGYCEKGKIRA